MIKPSVAIVGLSGCSGCQLTILNCEEELPFLAEKIEFSWFPLAVTSSVFSNNFDLALVEGCILSDEEADFVRIIRERSKILIAIGACASSGGIPSMISECRDITFHESSIQVRASAIESVVPVDYTLYGCPPEKHEILSLMADFINGVMPEALDYPVCMECRQMENPCLLTETKQLCLGSLTNGGCSALCPSFSVPCEGCRGLFTDANLEAAFLSFSENGFEREAVIKRLERFSSGKTS